MSCTEGGDQQDPLIDLPSKPKSGDLRQGHITTWVEMRQYACRFLRSPNCGQSPDRESSGAPCGRRDHSPSQWVSPCFLLRCSCSQRDDFPARLHGQAHLEVVCDTVVEFLETNHEREDVCHSGAGPSSSRWGPQHAALPFPLADTRCGNAPAQWPR